eukprot:Sdes_comp18388_c0_seq1m8213
MKLECMSCPRAPSVEENFGARKFYEIPEKFQIRSDYASSSEDSPQNDAKKTKLLTYIRENIIGEGVEFQGPFGSRKTFYCDYTASGKPLHFIEDYILNQVLPFYGNTHTFSSVTSLQTTLFRHEAR